MDVRNDLLTLVQQFPGLHIREAARQLGTSATLVEYHVQAMVSEGLLETETEGRYLRIYGAGDTTPEERRMLALLRQEIPAGVVLTLLDEPGMRHGDLARRLKLGKGRLSFHLDKLAAAGILTKADGLHVAAPETVGALMRKYRPIREHRSAFADVWLSLYES